ncbi:MAG: glycerate kinase [Acidimicrobiales bacterium]
MTEAPIAPGVVLAAMDKFRDTASARELCDAVARVGLARDRDVDTQPMSDGGEGFRDAFVGEEATIEVPGPLGAKVSAKVTLVPADEGPVGVLEVAEVIGRHLLGSPSRSDAWVASSAGVGDLIVACEHLGVQRLLIGCGGSATSDGGRGCYDVVRDAGGLAVPVTVATDVTARFSGARRYAEQKGIDPEDLEELDRRLEEVRALYLRDTGVDVEALDRAGASGGVPGALAALGAELVSGFDAVAQAVGLTGRVRAASFVVTGEGRFDGGSLEGKVVDGVAALVKPGTDLLVVCGSIEDEAAQIFRRRYPTVTMVSLVERFGEVAAKADAVGCVEAVVAQEIDGRWGDVTSE